MKSRETRVVVVGSNGYVGTLLLVRALEAGSAIGTLRHPTDAAQKLDLGESNTFDYANIHPTDVVMLTAGISSPDRCAQDYERSWRVNVEGTRHFIERVLERRARVIFFSSDTVYGEQQEDFDEARACVPAGEYGAMKYEVERRFSAHHNFKALRLSYVFSKDDKFTRYLSAEAEAGSVAEIFHPMNRAVIHRDDVVEGALSLARRWEEFPQSALNFGGPDVLSRVEFSETLRSTVLPNLRFSITQSPPEFFAKRPRVIQMKSPLLQQLLNRPARALSQAARIEFQTGESSK